MSFAALPMYDLPEIVTATNALWSGIARRLRAEGIDDVPAQLERGRCIEAQWRDPALLLGQSCGYPVTHAFSNSLRIVATPCHAVAGCDEGLYYSVVVVSDDAKIADLADLRGKVAVVNDPASHSGTNAFGALLAPLLATASDGRFFSEVLVSGSHVASLEMVAEKRASVAAIDCVTHALLARWRPAALVGTRILTTTASAPALPFVTSRSADDVRMARLRSALAHVMTDDALTAVRDDLLLSAVTVMPDSAYDVIPSMQARHRLGQTASGPPRKSP